MGPTISEIHVNRPLTNMMQSYMSDLSDTMVADKVFPQIPVLKRSDKYFSIPKGAWFKAGAAVRAPGTETVGINYHVNPDNDYVCKVYGVHFDLDDQTAANADAPLAGDFAATRFITRNLLITRELEWMQTYFQPGIWSGVNATGATVNSDYDVIGNGHGAWDTDNSDPIRDIRAMQTYIESHTGYEPKTLTLSKNVYDAVCNNKSILDRIRYTQRGVLTTDLLASMFQVDRLLVAKAVINTAQTGLADNMGFIANNGFLLSYAPSAPSLTDPSAGYTFNWTGYTGAGDNGQVMTTMRLPWLRSTRFEGEYSWALKMVASDLGAFGVNVLAKP